MQPENITFDQLLDKRAAYLKEMQEVESELSIRKENLSRLNDQIYEEMKNAQRYGSDKRQVTWKTSTTVDVPKEVNWQALPLYNSKPLYTEKTTFAADKKKMRKFINDNPGELDSFGITIKSTRSLNIESSSSV